MASNKVFQGEDGMPIQADNYCLADLHKFILAHKARPLGCLMTMMTFRADTPSSCGIVELDGYGVVIGFHEKVSKRPVNLADGAVYILSAEMLKILGQDFGGATDFSTDMLEHFVGRIYSYEICELFLDIGTPEAYGKANDFINTETAIK